MDWLDLLAVQGTLESLLQHHSSKASILQLSAFFIVPNLTSMHAYWEKKKKKNIIYIYKRTTIFTIAGVSANVYRFLINHLIITHDHVEENKWVI